MKLLSVIKIIVTLAFIPLCQGCESVDDQRIPNMPVNISIANAGLWNSYGVSGYGTNRNFIVTKRIPSGFPYASNSASGFGGVLLIEGLDPFMGNTSMPLAYDLACPVERNPETRVSVDPDSYLAKCPVCGSTYDVTMQKGAATAGPAATGNYRYALKSYYCIESGYGGYLITN